MPEFADPARTWADALELVTRLNAAGHAEARVELPGLSIYLSRTASPSGSDASPAPASDSVAVTLVEVPSPVLGVFYGRPSPGAPPFVDVDSDVGVDTTVAIVEVMKLMNQVTAGIAGRIVRICAADGELVEEGQPLYLVEPSDDGPAGVAT